MCMVTLKSGNSRWNSAGMARRNLIASRSTTVGVAAVTLVAGVDGATVGGDGCGNSTRASVARSRTADRARAATKGFGFNSGAGRISGVSGRALSACAVSGTLPAFGNSASGTTEALDVGATPTRSDTSVQYAANPNAASTSTAIATVRPTRGRGNPIASDPT